MPHCPRCNHNLLDPDAPCPHCGAPPNQPRKKNRWFLWVGLGCAAVVLLVLLILLIVGVAVGFLWAKPVHPISAPLAPPPASAVSANPVLNPADLHPALLAAPALAPIYADADKTIPLFQPTNEITLLSRRRWARAGEILTYRVVAQSRPTADVPLATVHVIIEAHVDDRGRLLTTRTLRIEDPTELTP